MRFYTKQHKADGGRALPARSLSMGILSQDGERLLHRHRKTSPEMFRKAIAPYRAELVVCGACLFTWYWLADLCAREGMPLVLGPARSLNAIHGGKAKHDKSAAHKSAVRLRGGLWPQAYVSPAALRATRARRRRRIHLMRTRAERLTHVPHTNRQDKLPEMGQQSASPATRDGVAERLPEPAVPQRIAVDRALLGPYDELLRDLALALVTTAPPPDAHPLYLRQTVPGLGQMLRLVLLDDIHDIARVPRGQDCVSSGRLVKCAKASVGKR